MIGLSHDVRRLSDLRARIATALAIMLVAATGAAAEPAYSFDAAPGKLPKTIVPLHYAIELVSTPSTIRPTRAAGR